MKKLILLLIVLLLAVPVMAQEGEEVQKRQGYLVCDWGLLTFEEPMEHEAPYITISSPDDYFSLGMLTVWFFFGVLAAPNDLSQGEWHLLTFFIMTACFLIYVPFSKIMHYLWYPFTRYYFGKTMGYRGVYPVARG